MFSSSSTTRVMSLFGRLKARKLITGHVHDYPADIQSTCDSHASCGHPIDEMRQISIILDGVNGQFDNVVSIIHASRNPYDLAYVSSVLMDAETRNHDQLFHPVGSSSVSSYFRRFLQIIFQISPLLLTKVTHQMSICSSFKPECSCV